MFSDHFNGLICFSRVGMTRVECLRYKGLVRVGEKKAFTDRRRNITD